MKRNMHLNLKTNVLHFCKNLHSKARSTFHFTFNGDDLSQYKYLGLVLNEHLNLSNTLVCKANWALALLNHRMRATGGFHLKTYTLVYDQLVQPIIMTNAFEVIRYILRSPIYNTVTSASITLEKCSHQSVSPTPIPCG